MQWTVWGVLGSRSWCPCAFSVAASARQRWDTSFVSVVRSSAGGPKLLLVSGVTEMGTRWKSCCGLAPVSSCSQRWSRGVWRGDRWGPSPRRSLGRAGNVTAAERGGVAMAAGSASPRRWQLLKQLISTAESLSSVLKVSCSCTGRDAQRLYCSGLGPRWGLVLVVVTAMLLQAIHDLVE